MRSFKNNNYPKKIKNIFFTKKSSNIYYNPKLHYFLWIQSYINHVNVTKPLLSFSAKTRLMTTSITIYPQTNDDDDAHRDVSKFLSLVKSLCLSSIAFFQPYMA